MEFGVFGGAKGNLMPRHGMLSGERNDYRHFIDYVQYAEKVGFKHAFVVEHHSTGSDHLSSSIALLTFIAAKTSTMRLGTAVVVLPWHNPLLLAETVATLDLLSGGRFDFGIGRGYKKEEFEVFCLPMEEAAARFDETFAFLKQAWTEEGRFSFQGKFWRYQNVTVEPKPAQRPHPPFWMAASSPDSIVRAARENINLLLDQIGSIDATIKRVEIYREEKIRLGLPFDPKSIAITRGMRVVDNEAERAASLEEYAKLLDRDGALRFGPVQGPEGRAAYIKSDAALFGTPEQISRQLERLEAGGVEIVLMNDVRRSMDGLQRFSTEIMPGFMASVEPQLVRVGRA